MNSCAHTLLERLNLNFHAASTPDIVASKNSQLSRLREDLSTLLNTRGLVSTWTSAKRLTSLVLY